MSDDDSDPGKERKRRMTLREALETAREQVRRMPAWERALYARNDALIALRNRTRKGE